MLLPMNLLAFNDSLVVSSLAPPCCSYTTYKGEGEKLVKLGLSSTWSDKRKFLSFEEYRKSMLIARESESKFQDMADQLRGQIIVDLLMDDFHLLWQIKNLFLNPPTYEKYTKLDITYR